MSPEKIERINLELLLEYAASLPTSPRIFARLSQLLNNEDTALDYIASLVKMDPGLSAQVLRVTNSAYYGASLKVTDISTAISRIGFIELRNILALVVAHECFYQALPAYGLTATEFADTSIDVAIISETIAKRSGYDANAPYITGLLHQIGKLAINLYLERLDQVTDLAALAGSRPVTEAEKERLGMNHFQVGAELLSHWQFQALIWQPIRNQYRPEYAHSHATATAILSLAIWMADELEGRNQDFEHPSHLKIAFKQLGIDALDLPRLLDDSRFEINDRKNLLSMLL